MVYNWNIGFESTPGGSDFGNIMGLALRNVQKAFKERLERDHIFDTGAAPLCYHLAGLCTIIGLTDDSTPATNLVVGALQLSTIGGLFRDTGSTMENIGVLSHLGLVGTEHWEDDHPQYVPVLPTLGYVDITGDVVMNSHLVTGLPSDLGGGETDYYILSRGMHLKEAVAGGARHDNGVVTAAISFSDGIPLPLEKLAVTMTSQAAVGNGNLTLEDYCTFPIMADGSNDEGEVIAQVGLSGDDFVGRIGFRNMGSTHTFRYARFNAG